MKTILGKTRSQTTAEFISQFEVGDRVGRKEFQSYLNIEAYQVQVGIIREILGDKARVEWSWVPNRNQNNPKNRPKDTTIKLKNLVFVFEGCSSSGDVVTAVTR